MRLSLLARHGISRPKEQRDCLPSLPLATEICVFQNHILIAAIGQSVGLSPTLPHVGVRVLVNGRSVAATAFLDRVDWTVNKLCAERIESERDIPACRCDCRLAGNHHPMLNTTGTSETLLLQLFFDARLFVRQLQRSPRCTQLLDPDEVAHHPHINSSTRRWLLQLISRCVVAHFS